MVAGVVVLVHMMVELLVELVVLILVSIRILVSFHMLWCHKMWMSPAKQGQLENLVDVSSVFCRPIVIPIACCGRRCFDHVAAAVLVVVVVSAVFAFVPFANLVLPVVVIVVFSLPVSVAFLLSIL